jgi:hypothetical protein
MQSGNGHSPATENGGGRGIPPEFVGQVRAVRARLIADTPRLQSAKDAVIESLRVDARRGRLTPWLWKYYAQQWHAATGDQDRVAPYKPDASARRYGTMAEDRAIPSRMWRNDCAGRCRRDTGRILGRDSWRWRSRYSCESNTHRAWFRRMISLHSEQYGSVRPPAVKTWLHDDELRDEQSRQFRRLRDLGPRHRDAPTVFRKLAPHSDGTTAGRTLDAGGGAVSGWLRRP